MLKQKFKMENFLIKKSFIKGKKTNSTYQPLFDNLHKASSYSQVRLLFLVMLTFAYFEDACSRTWNVAFLKFSRY